MESRRTRQRSSTRGGGAKLAPRACRLPSDLLQPAALGLGTPRRPHTRQHQTQGPPTQPTSTLQPLGSPGSLGSGVQAWVRAPGPASGGRVRVQPPPLSRHLPRVRRLLATRLPKLPCALAVQAAQMSAVPALQPDELVRRLRSPQQAEQVHAARALWELAGSSSSADSEALVGAGCLPPLLELLHSASEKARWSAAAALGTLAAGSSRGLMPVKEPSQRCWLCAPVPAGSLQPMRPWHFSH